MFNVLAQSSIELNALEAQNVVKVAGVLRRLWNWFKQLQNPEYKEKVIQLSNDSAHLKDRLNDLEVYISKLRQSISDADVDDYNIYLEKVKHLSKELSDELAKINLQTEEIKTNIPQPQEAAQQKPPQTSTEQQHSTEYDVPIGTNINLSYESSQHFLQLTPNDMFFSQNMKLHGAKNVRQALLRNKQIPEPIKNTILKDLIENPAGLNSFFDRLKLAVPKGTIIYNYYPPIDEKRERPEGQMEVKIAVPEFDIPEFGLKISLIATFYDRLAQKVPEKKLIAKRITNINISYSAETERKSSRMDNIWNLFVKFAKSGLNHKWARDVILEAFKSEMGREPTLAELQGAQAVGMRESNYGQGWIKNYGDDRAKGSNNWGAIQAGRPKDGVCPPGTFLYQDTRPQRDGTNIPYKICFKAYASPVDGARDLIRKLYKSNYKGKNSKPRGQALLEAAAEGSLNKFSQVMYDTNYYEGWGKTRDERIANHIKYLDSGIKSIASALGEPVALKTTAISIGQEFRGSVPENFRRLKETESNKDLQQISKQILSRYIGQPYGFSVPFEYNGTKYLAVLEEHVGGAVAGKHPGISLFIEDKKTTATMSRSQKALVGVDSRLKILAEKFIELASQQGISIVITTGFRSMEEQERLYQQGRTTEGAVVTHAKPGVSKHNYGLAIDVAPLDKNGNPYWPNDESLWEKIGRIGESLGLKWGGRWPEKYRDRPHFELSKGGIDMAEQIAKEMPKKDTPKQETEEEDPIKSLWNLIFGKGDKIDVSKQPQIAQQQAKQTTQQISPQSPASTQTVAPKEEEDTESLMKFLWANDNNLNFIVKRAIENKLLNKKRISIHIKSNGDINTYANVAIKLLDKYIGFENPVISNCSNGYELSGLTVEANNTNNAVKEICDLINKYSKDNSLEFFVGEK